MLINFLVQTLQSTETLDFFADKKLKKETSSKVGYFSIIEEIFISALAAKTVKFMFSNLAYYRPTV